MFWLLCYHYCGATLLRVMYRMPFEPALSLHRKHYYISDLYAYFVTKMCVVQSDHLFSGGEPNCNPSFSFSLNNHIQIVGILIIDSCRKIKVIVSGFHRILCISGLHEVQIVCYYRLLQLTRYCYLTDIQF